MTKSKQYTKLLEKRSNFVRLLQHYDGKVKNLDETSPRSITFALQTLPIIESSYEKYVEKSNELEDHDDFEFTDLNPKTEAVLDLYVDITAKLKEILGEGRTQPHLNSTVNNQSQNPPPLDLKLPQVKIPTFSGEPEEWVSFHDTFSTYVDNTLINDVSKMHYLKSSLAGSAYKMIANYPTSEANYKIAWKTLCDRFNNKRLIVNKALETIHEQEPLSNPNAVSIRDLIDTTKQALQCIETQRIKTESWDPMIVYLIQTKLGNELTKQWETELGGSFILPNYEQMLKFLETQYRIYSAIAVPSTSAKAQIIATTEKMRNKEKNNNERNRCPLCNGEHWLFSCSTFDNYSDAEKWKYVNDNKLCENCLHSHPIEQCRSKYKCKTCNGKHNTKLHACIRTMAIQLDNNPQNEKLLATAIVKVKDKSGNTHLLRAFIDGLGSEGR